MWDIDFDSLDVTLCIDIQHLRSDMQLLDAKYFSCYFFLETILSVFIIGTNTGKVRNYLAGEIKYI